VSHYALSTPLTQTYPGSSVGVAAAENLDNAAGLKLESSIYHSGLDALDYRDGGPSSESRRIGQDTIMNSAQLPLLAVAPSQPAMLLGDYNSGGLPFNKRNQIYNEYYKVFCQKERKQCNLRSFSGANT
jgi:hypothetical protein